MAEPVATPPGRRDPGPPNGRSQATVLDRIRTGRSYSRFVATMRVVLPLVAMAIVVLVIAWPQLGEKPKQFSLGISKVTVHDSGGQQMINARFTGTDRRGRPYTVTADSAAQTSKVTDAIELAFPKADMTLKDGAWLAMSAQTGLFDRKTQKLALSGGVNLFHDSGYEMRTATASIDLATGNAEGSDPVEAQGPGGTLSSHGFKLLDQGNRVLFSGKSKLVLFPVGEARGKAPRRKDGPG